ncbi:MAG: hypothetical protein V1735_02085 [Nanoarchaeota archaeon]
MIRKQIFLFILIFFNVQIVLAGCPNNRTVIDSEEIKTVVSDMQGNELEPLRIYFPNQDGQPLEITNLNKVNLSILLDITINVKGNSNCPEENVRRNFEIIVPAEDVYKLNVEKTTANQFCTSFIFTEPHLIEYRKTGEVDIQLKKIVRDHIECPDNNTKTLLITGIGIGLIVFLLIFFTRTEKKRKEKKIEAIVKEKSVLEEKKGELSELELINKKTGEIKKQIKKKNDEINAENRKYRSNIIKNNKLHEEYIEPRLSKILGGGTWEWRNPNRKYYPCYVNKGIKTEILIHRDRAEKKIFKKYPDFFKNKYPNVSFSQLEVHHIDTDYDNYEEKNLIILSNEEHGCLHKNINVKKGDWEDGIKELKRNKITAPHISELKDNS